MTKQRMTLSKKYSLVDDYLVRGPHPSVSELFRLKGDSWNITQIYDFRHLSCWHFKFIERLCCKLLNIKYIHVPYSNLYGNYPELQTFENIGGAVKQNGENGGRTLFHCNSGRHRTSHFSAFYKLTGGETLDNIKLNPDYENVVKNVVQKQIIEHNYFSRTVIKYDGHNPIKKVWVKRNNMVAMGLERAHNLFMDMLR